MAAFNQGGLFLPGSSTILQATEDPSRPTGNATAVILTTPVLTAAGMTNMAFRMPTVLMPHVISSRSNQETSHEFGQLQPRKSQEMQDLQERVSTSHTKEAESLKLSPSISPYGGTNHTHLLEKFHRTKTSPSVHPHNDDQNINDMENESPLDLSVAKIPSSEIKVEKNISHSLSPDKDRAIDTRSEKRESPLSSVSPSAPKTSPKSKFRQDLRLRDGRTDNVKMSPTTLNEVDEDNHRQCSSSPIPSNSESPFAESSLILRRNTAPLLSPTNIFTMSQAFSPKRKMHTSQGVLHSPTTSNGISKCADCNIVFYKLENYLIHREHYCSGKRKGNDIARKETQQMANTDDETSDIEAGSPHDTSPLRSGRNSQVPLTYQDSPTTPSQGTSPPSTSTNATDLTYKYYCVPCRIKFSNASILEAHKEYYCPSGKDSEQSLILESAEHLSNSSQPEVKNEPPESPQEEFTCTRCSSVFSSARLLRLHMCEGGFPCPHCDHVAITENRLTEHLKVHAPTKAFRCTICGYRGNTARGMRMHGKTHIDEGLDYTDENMLEYHEPALMPIVHSSTTGVCTDSDLLRLKNEPYKRRRSRKAYEKFDYPLPKVDIPQTCPLCGQNFVNVDFLASHFKVHEIAASQYIAGLMKCIHCDYIGTSPDNLRSHFEENHTNHVRRLTLDLNTSVGLSDDRMSSTSPENENIQIQHGDHNETSQTINQVSLKVKRGSPSEKTLTTTIFSENDHERSQSKSKTVHHIETEDSKTCIKQEPIDKIDVDGEIVDHFLHSPPPRDMNEAVLKSSNNCNASRSPPSTFLTSIADNDHRKNSNHIFGQPQLSPNKKSPVETDIFYDNTQYNSPSGKTPSDDLTITNSSESKQLSMYPMKSLPDKSEGVVDNSFKKANRGADSAGLFIKHEQLSPVNNAQTIPITSHDDKQHDSPEAPKHVTTSKQTTQQPASPQVLKLFESVSSNSSHFLNPNSNTPSSSPSKPPSSSDEVEPRANLKQSTPRFTQKEAAPNTTMFLPKTSLISSSFTFPYASNSALPYYFLPPQHHLPKSDSSAMFSCLQSGDQSESRYCKNCDISFSKQATYLAHKKYYCTARPQGENASLTKA